MLKRWIAVVAVCTLVAAMLLPLCGCGATPSVKAADLAADVEPTPVDGTPVDDAFVRSQLKLAGNFLQRCVSDDKDENVLLSPLSIQLALAITANGARGDTRQEMETLLGDGLTIQQLNGYLAGFMNALPQSEQAKLHVANSIWFRDDADRLQVKPAFLQTNADYYVHRCIRPPLIPPPCRM